MLIITMGCGKKSKNQSTSGVSSQTQTICPAVFPFDRLDIDFVLKDYANFTYKIIIDEKVAFHSCDTIDSTVPFVSKFQFLDTKLSAKVNMSHDKGQWPEPKYDISLIHLESCNEGAKETIKIEVIQEEVEWVDQGEPAGEGCGHVFSGKLVLEE